MRTQTDWFCDTRGDPGCEVKAAVTFVCKVEGREVALCRACDRAWKAKARETPGLEFRCPNCYPQFLAQKAAAEAGNSAINDRNQLLTGPVADMITTAMYRAGVLIDARQRVLHELYRLAHDSDGYTAMLLRSTAEQAVPT